MIEIRHVTLDDHDFWFSLDKHLSEKEFLRKIRDEQGYVLFDDGEPRAILRYNLMWDSIPICTMLFVDWAFWKKGYGRMIMEHWEHEMREMGYDLIFTSTQVNESSQHFYRKLGYKDCGAIVMDVPGYEQPLEMFMNKRI